jgi:type IV pilus assembly protein PilA
LIVLQMNPEFVVTAIVRAIGEPTIAGSGVVAGKSQSFTLRKKSVDTTTNGSRSVTLSLRWPTGLRNQPTCYGCRIREGDVMETGKSVARLRTVRELLGRTGREDEGDEREEGFTLIELMVVLLIMGILLAIAIPTFLSVTGGAKKTAAQSDLTNAYTSLQGVYSGNSGTLPQTATGKAPTLNAIITKLGKTQTSIKFTTGTAAKGRNTVSVKLLTANKTAVALAARDGAGFCWMVVFNDTGKVATVTNGPKYAGFTTGGKSTTKCNGGMFATVKKWYTSWGAVPKPAT